ncbi:hypothetical protein C8A00DRAFT_36147 [Chaetomidium leptoderma]|uniref:Uncharacterized protein n=1 Tax=Chaetomidium leptoderma TaxID=669021 RepID=A0AAN6ZUB2_9PEZI|nr:hypothetical protein C8A00DRAFT_36147 [Chaetomidium leptoderma]
MALSTSIPALSTPFVQPATCTDIFSTWILTATVGDTYIRSQSTIIEETVVLATVTVSDPTDARFTTCQPPGWADVVPESRFAFSPAVCPSGWTAYNLRTDGPVSTAYCCASGYSLAGPRWATIDSLQTPGCFKRATPKGSGVMDTFPDPTDVQVHNAYRISWQASDTAMLTPQQPAITCPYGIDEWVPGSPVTSTACNTPVNDTSIPAGVGGFVTIGVPIIKGKHEQRIRAARAAREQNDGNHGAPASEDQS